MIRFRSVVRTLGSAAVLSMIFIVMFLIAKTLAGAQERSQSAPPASTSTVDNLQPMSEITERSREKDDEQSGNISVQASENSGPGEAADSGGEESEEDKTAQLKYSSAVKWMAGKLGVTTTTAYGLSVALNFVTIVGVAGVFLRSKLPVWFRERTQLIRQGLDEAQSASAEAQQRLSAIESRIGKLQSEIAGMQSVADQQSAVEEQRIRAAAEEESHKIVEEAEQEVAAAVKLARRDFKAYVGGLAVTLAAKRIQVDAAADEGLVRSFIDRLGRNGNGKN